MGANVGGLFIYFCLSDFNLTFGYVKVRMRRSPKNVRIAFDDAGLTRYGGVLFFHEFTRGLPLRRFLTRHLQYPRRNQRSELSQLLLALIPPIVLGLDRLETASLLRANGTFQYLTGLPSYPDPQTLRRFLLQAPPEFRQQLHRFNDRLLRQFIHQPEHRSRLILDWDRTVVTVFGRQEGAEVGYNPRYRDKRSHDPLLCLAANSAFLWDTELRPGNAGTWAGREELMASCFLSIPADIRELRVRADAGFGFHPVLARLEHRPAQSAVGARLTSAFKRVLGGLRYHRLNAHWEMAEFEHRLTGWPCARRGIGARRKREETESEPPLFALDRYLYRAWFTHLSLPPAGVWNFYEGRGGMEPRIRQLREDYALRKIPTRAFAANALYWEIVRLAYNWVTAFQRTCLPEDWQSLTLNKLRHRLFWLPGELTRPQNRPALRLPNRPAIQEWTTSILHQVHKLKPLDA